jgi:phenylalanyl-tRNA synthetase alpha chain
LRDRWLARKNGLLTKIDERWLKTTPHELKPDAGRQFNLLRGAAAELELDKLLPYIPLKPEPVYTVGPIVLKQAEPTMPDLTLPGYRSPLGSLHPITRVQRELEEIFLGLGFAIETGPEIESVYYNFDALNIPENHAARDDMDSLYVDSRTVLRTHTSPVQIRAMKKRGAPLYIIVPGRVYRRDNPDATHSPVFHQIEGLAVDKDITFADLKGTLDFFAKKFFGENIRTSFHPTFFPFTEPSGELSISCNVCDGQGCRFCKESGWIEVMDCGMVHPQVVRNGGIDPERYCGWAFGLGVDRFALMKYGINDIQLFFQNDLRFLEQF